jgi:hypothetical protein
MGNFQSPVEEKDLKKYFHPPIQRSVLSNKIKEKKEKEETEKVKQEQKKFKKIEGKNNFSILVRNKDDQHDYSNKRSFDNVLKNKKNQYRNSRRKNDYYNDRNYYDNRGYYDSYEDDYEDDYYNSNVGYKRNYDKPKRDKYNDKNTEKNTLKKQDSIKNTHYKPKTKSIKQPRKRFRNKKKYKQVSN